MKGFPPQSQLISNGIRERKSGQETRMLISEGPLVWAEFGRRQHSSSNTPYVDIRVAFPMQPLVIPKLGHGETRVLHGRQTQQLLLVILIEALHDKGEHPTKKDFTTKRMVVPCINNPVPEKATKVEGAL